MNFTYMGPMWSYDSGDNVRTKVSADGEYIISGDGAGYVRLFQKNNSVPIWSFNHDLSTVYAVSVSADGEYVAVGNFQGEIFLFDIDSSTPLWDFDTDESSISSIDISSSSE